MRQNELLTVPLIITGNVTIDNREKYINEYYEKYLEEYNKNIECLIYLRSNKNKLNDILNILDNEILLPIHKRKRIYKIMKNNKKIEEIYIYKFIEKILLIGYKTLEDLLINNFTLKNINENTLEEYVFKDYQIKNNEYKYIFDEEKINISFIRDI